MDLIGIYLMDALGEGCPVCRILRKYEDSEIEIILYEHVNDPDVREKFRESLGLCTHHAWKTLEKAYSEPLLGPLGVAMIYEHMLGVYADLLENGTAPEEGECFLCKLMEDKERSTVEAFADRIGELLPEYERSGSILCKRHYEMVLELLERKNPEAAEKLRELQIRKLKGLGERLGSFIDRFDYRAKEAPKKEEVSALPLAIEALKGLETGVTVRKRRSKKQRGILPWK
ncbi:DUF6062 family protein [Thermococcus celer]|uniref:Uncharacterized protein n=1 Tax=Thermococcus celer Vu 13 = JCM 8558 TaxID=1293037 RepID=A0A218P258_THECE|nr:DUF6062 family protein [Thermococcus celer]ASI98994.1 hypothetical protein A3L02_05155 [Thermococcus celer Vu 13 = JCM 8558]